jgi:hypothetical protein
LPLLFKKVKKCFPAKKGKLMKTKKRQTTKPQNKKLASAKPIEDNRAKRRAALVALEHYTGDVIVPAKQQVLQEANVDELAATVKAEVHKRYIGELVSSAMTYRQMGVRALARKVKRSHSQIVALERSHNMELSTLLTIADSLEFDVEIRLRPREGGKAIQAAL